MKSGPMNPKYPIYILSKGRWENPLTANALERMKVPYNIVVEPREYAEYCKTINPNRIIKAPENFSDRKQGAVPVRNFIWDHAQDLGVHRHWQLDDNIRFFSRLYKNRKIKCATGVCFKVCEILTDRYQNVAQSGLQYAMFATTMKHWGPVIVNTRVYSCVLNPNWLDYRYRGTYNDDTDLSLRILKDGWCTLQIVAFLCKKVQTGADTKGGMGNLYHGDGRLKMAQSLQRQHPDLVTVKQRFHRWQHVVNYSSFKKNKLKLKKGIQIPEDPMDFGLYLREKEAWK